MGDVDAEVHMYTFTALGRGRMASPTPSHFYPMESSQYSFYRWLSGAQDQSGHKRSEENLHLSDTRDQTQAVQHLAT